MIGETVIVDGKDVENVLVSSSGYNKVGTEGDTDITDWIGPVADYKLYFPIDFTTDLTGKTVTVRGIECEVMGHPDHEHPREVFGAWNGNWDMVAAVKRVLPEQAETITVYYTEVTRDYLGKRTLGTPSVIYTGAAQARQEKAGENVAQTGRVSNAIYYFVIPYVSGIYELPTQCLTVSYRERIFDVESIEDVSEKGERISIKAVWRDV